MYAHTQTHTQMHTHTHTYAHTQTHTHVHTHTTRSHMRIHTHSDLELDQDTKGGLGRGGLVEVSLDAERARLHDGAQVLAGQQVMVQERVLVVERRRLHARDHVEHPPQVGLTWNMQTD
jgi:hypothetical protein